MRTKNSFINLIVSWSTQIINILLQFILRTVFINILTTEYLGLNGLFSNILSCLSFAELGFGAAITFSLYKPLAENDEKTIAGIMNFFKKVYFAVGLFVLVAGLSLVPFITKLINDIPDIKYIHLIYALWVLNSGISYFLVYKSTLIIADQRKDIVEKNNFVFKIIQLVLQVIILILTRNYVFYLLVQIFVTIVTNISISVIADKRYPFLIRKRNEKINLDILSEIKKNVCATVLHKIGAVVIFGTDNILLSKFFGLVIVGLYSNYYLIINTLTNLVGQIQASIVASVGNLGVNATDEKKIEVFDKYLFMNFWIFCFTTSCLVSLLNPFIDVWLGKDYLIPVFMTVVLTFNYFLAGFRSAAATFNNAFGLFWNTRKLPVVESILNIVLSIIFIEVFGYIGIFLGTTISSLSTGTWYEPFILYYKGFHKPPFLYYKRLIEYFLVAIVSMFLFIFVIDGIPFSGLGGFILKFLVSVIGSNIFLFIVYFKTKRIKYIYEMTGKVKEVILRKV